MKRVLIAVTAASMLSISSAQNSQSAFEVTSIRRNLSGDARSGVSYQPGRFVAENATTKMIIAYAYNVKDFQISGGPSWLDDERFNVTAKEDDSVAEGRLRLPWNQYREQLGLMVQSLLADRFQLRVIRQSRESAILALVTAKDGPKLERSATPDLHSADIRGRRGQLIAKGLSLAQLADILSWMPEVGVRKVVNETWIAGTFDLSLRWAFDRTPAATPPAIVSTGVPPDIAAPDVSEPSIFDAVHEQLGLKLEARKGPVEVLVVDHIERPSDN